VCLVAWPLNGGGARVDPVLIETSLLSLIYATGKPEDSGQQNDEKMARKNGNYHAVLHNIFWSFYHPESSSGPVV